MYYYIKGEVVIKQDSFAVLDSNGVGYKIFTSQTTLDSLKTGEQATLYTYLHVREDVFDLYGFASSDEHSMFLNLLSVSGVGPKAALSILSIATPQKLAVAIITNDTKTITKASGVGAKMAQRVILELKDKLKNADILPPDEDIDIPESGGSQSEAVSALMVLGYSQNEAKKAVSQVDASLSTEEIVKQALIKIMR